MRLAAIWPRWSSPRLVSANLAASCWIIGLRAGERAPDLSQRATRGRAAPETEGLGVFSRAVKADCRAGVHSRLVPDFRFSFRLARAICFWPSALGPALAT